MLVAASHCVRKSDILLLPGFVWTVCITTGDSISGRNDPISESSKAIAPSYLNKISINSRLSLSERNPGQFS